MRAKTFLGACGALLCLTGCGGSTTGASTANPSNNVRPNVTGDAFTYSLTGTYKATPTSLATHTTGTSTVMYQANTYASQPALEETTTTVLNLASGTDTLTANEQLSSAGVTLGVTDAGTLTAVSSGGFTRPTMLSATTSINGTETLADGTTVTLGFAVTGTLNVTTTAGTFPCWVATRTITYSDGFTSVETMDFAPLIGAVVQDVIQNTYSNGFSFSVTSSLTTYAFGGT
jgi:hypothetical protein